LAVLRKIGVEITRHKFCGEAVQRHPQPISQWPESTLSQMDSRCSSYSTAIRFSALVASHSACRIAMPLPALLQNSHQNGG
jgi:hypothetical protein